MAAALLGFTGCLFDDEESGEPPLTQATLAETGLAGDFDMVDFKLEFTDGQVIDSSRVKLKGWMRISADSAYIQRIWINETPTDTEGRLTAIRAQIVNRRKGEVTLTLDGSSESGVSRFELRGDTLTWSTDVEPSKDGKKPGFKETGRYLRTPVP